VHGVEISPFAARCAQQHLGSKVVEGTLEEACFPAGHFHVITLLDVFEHFTKPLAELRLAAQMLHPDGVLVINTPNEHALLRKLARVMYVASLGRIEYPVTKLYHEYHLSYFSRLSLLRSLTECGFELRLIESKPMVGVKGRASPLLRKALRGLSWVEGLLDMQYELLAVARKAKYPGRAL
jgi:2-polyprenyl-3-methyl-5-hydroxy-6-metoxy-1,4-benzoquinol methylase